MCCTLIYTITRVKTESVKGMRILEASSALSKVVIDHSLRQFSTLYTEISLVKCLRPVPRYRPFTALILKTASRWSLLSYGR